ncbi:MAG TPA: hypothetical protein VFS13_00230, partial [Steroidobacteraceae bacterium]|nr:hypothetical protein [Steroidobacteraceae bacterium]
LASGMQAIYKGSVPRFLRLRDAPSYLGMDKNRFNRDVRPNIAAIPIGAQGIAFDRLDLDSWADDYKSRNGRPAADRSKPWDNDERPASPNVARSGMSINGSRDTDAFAKAVARATSTKRRDTSIGGSNNFASSSSTAKGGNGRLGKQRPST